MRGARCSKEHTRLLTVLCIPALFMLRERNLPFADTDALVQTKIVQPDGTSVELGLRVRGTEEQMKIIDVVVGA